MYRAFLLSTLQVASPPCHYVYSVGVEIECFCRILPENHSSLTAVGSEVREALPTLKQE